MILFQIFWSHIFVLLKNVAFFIKKFEPSIPSHSLELMGKVKMSGLWAHLFINVNLFNELFNSVLKTCLNGLFTDLVELNDSIIWSQPLTARLSMNNIRLRIVWPSHMNNLLLLFFLILFEAWMHRSTFNLIALKRATRTLFKISHRKGSHLSLKQHEDE